MKESPDEFLMKLPEELQNYQKKKLLKERPEVVEGMPRENQREFPQVLSNEFF